MGDLLEYGRQRVVVITGADRGLGLALVQEYLKRGDRVFAGKYGKNWHLMEKLKESFPDALSIVDLDVRNNESVAKAADFILANTNAIDILINNAAVWKEQNTGTILEDKMDYEAMMEQFNVNALGALRVTHALIHAVLNSFDQLVVNVSSEAGSMSECTKDTQFGYCMSKAALNMARGFIRILDEPERFSAHMPGFVNYRGDKMNW